jgi:hypothetical protein
MNVSQAFVDQLTSLIGRRAPTGEQLKMASARATRDNIAPIEFDDCPFCLGERGRSDQIRADYEGRIRQMEEERLEEIRNATQVQEQADMEARQEFTQELQKHLGELEQIRGMLDTQTQAHTDLYQEYLRRIEELEEANAILEEKVENSLSLAFTQEQRADKARDQLRAYYDSSFPKWVLYFFWVVVVVLAGISYVIGTNQIHIRDEMIAFQAEQLEKVPTLELPDYYGQTFMGCVARLFY